MRLYLDGASVATAGGVDAYNVDNAVSVRVNRNEDGAVGYGDITAQDVALFNRALSATEIAYLYQLGKAGLERVHRPAVVAA